jgi:hypothetical protein
MIPTRKFALGVAGVVAAGVLGTAGVAAATSDDSGAPQAVAPAVSSSPAPGDQAGKKGEKRHKVRRALVARGMHGEWVVKGKDGKPTTLVSIRGQVTAVGPASVTVKAEDGFTETFTANSDTRVKGVDSIGAVKVGAKGAVVGVKSENGNTARLVLVRK